MHCRNENLLILITNYTVRMPYTKLLPRKPHIVSISRGTTQCSTRTHILLNSPVIRLLNNARNSLGIFMVRIQEIAAIFSNQIICYMTISIYTLLEETTIINCSKTISLLRSAYAQIYLYSNCEIYISFHKYKTNTNKIVS